MTEITTQIGDLVKKEDSLGDRIKGYENIARSYLPKRTFTVIRIDGKCFHTFTKGLDRPYDVKFMKDMDSTAKYLCENISGAKLGFVQSDEISILYTDFDSLNMKAWFEGNIQKICSVSSSLATAKFNQLELDREIEHVIDCCSGTQFDSCLPEIRSLAMLNLANFDSRTFTISELTEVNNYFLWRQQDATRNSIQMLAQVHFSHKELQGKNSLELQEMLMTEKLINWNNTPVGFKRGRAVVKTQEVSTHTRPGDVESIQVYRSNWVVEEPPIFSKDLEYIPNQVKKAWKQV